MPKKLIVGLMALILAGLGMTFSGQVQAQTTTNVNLGNFRVVNALVGLGTVDVYLDGELVAYQLLPEQATPYLVIPTGSHRLSILPSSALPDAEPIVRTLFELDANHSRTAVAYQTTFATSGRAAPGYAGAGSIIFIDDDRSPIPLGRTRLTAVHLAPDAPVRLNIGYPSRASLLHEVGLEAPYGAVDMDAGIRSLAVLDATTSTLNILSRTGDISFYADTYYTLVIVPDVTPAEGDRIRVGAGSAQPRLFAVSAPLEAPPNGIRMRVIHGAHDTAVVDVYIDERLVAPRVNYGLTSQYLGLTPYSHTIALRPFGAPPDSPPLARADFTISADNIDQKYWSLVLLNASADPRVGLPIIPADGELSAEATPSPYINTRGGQMIMALLPDDISQTRRGYARVRLIHALDGFPELSLYTPGQPLPLPGQEVEATPTTTPTVPLQLVDKAVFASEAGEAEVISGFYPEMNIRLALTNNTIATLRDTYLAEGLVYTFVVIGSNEGDPPLEVLQLADYGSGMSVNVLYAGQVKGLVVNVREQPRDTASIVSVLPRDTNVVVVGRNANADWVRVRFNDPDTGSLQEGWIFGDLVGVLRLGVPISIRSLPVFAGVG